MPSGELPATTVTPAQNSGCLASFYAGKRITGVSVCVHEYELV